MTLSLKRQGFCFKWAKAAKAGEPGCVACGSQEVGCIKKPSVASRPARGSEEPLFPRHPQGEMSPLWPPGPPRFCCFLPSPGQRGLPVLGRSRAFIAVLNLKSSWVGEREKAGQREEKPSEKFQRRHLLLFSSSSWDYFLCAEPTRDRRAPQRGFGAILFESSHPLHHPLYTICSCG